MQDLIQAFSFIFANIHVAGWLCLIGLSLRLSWQASKLFSKISDSLDRAKGVEDTVNLLASNHLPHLQIGIDNLVDEFRELRSTLLQILLKK